MIWAIVSSWSCFCRLYRASPSLAAKNRINLILVLTFWWCPCVESSLCCWKRVFAMTNAFSRQNSISLCPASFHTPRLNLPVTTGVSWLPTFYPKVSSNVLHCPPTLFSPQYFWTGHSLISVMWVNSRELLNIFIFRRNMLRNFFLKYISESWHNSLQKPHHNPLNSAQHQLLF